MTLLDRRLAARFLTLFGQVLVTFLALFVLIDLFTHRQEQIVKYEVPAAVAARYYLALLPVVLFEYQAVAVAVLGAGLMVLGRAAQDHEVTALLAGGVSIRRIASPLLILAGLIALAAFFVQDRFGVMAAAEARRIEHEYFNSYDATQRAGLSWPRLGGEWNCHILTFNRAANTGQDVFLHRIAQGRVDEIRAHRIFWEASQRRWLLEDGRWATFDLAQEGGGAEVRITQQPAPFTEPPEELFALEAPPQSKSARQLWRDLQLAARSHRPVAPQWSEFHAKFARPAVCFIMMLLAIPFALRLRRGGMAGLAGGVLISVVYLVMSYLGMGMGQLALMPPLLSAWLANLFFAAAGLWLLRATPT
jgi:lipopolysaccharide export system permease protein